MQTVVGVLVRLKREGGRRETIHGMTRLAVPLVGTVCELPEMDITVTVIAGVKTSHFEFRTRWMAELTSCRPVFSFESEASSLVIELGFLEL